MANKKSLSQASRVTYAVVRQTNRPGKNMCITVEITSHSASRIPFPVLSYMRGNKKSPEDGAKNSEKLFQDNPLLQLITRSKRTVMIEVSENTPEMKLEEIVDKVVEWVVHPDTKIGWIKRSLPKKKEAA